MHPKFKLASTACVMALAAGGGLLVAGPAQAATSGYSMSILNAESTQEWMDVTAPGTVDMTNSVAEASEFLVSSGSEPEISHYGYGTCLTRNSDAIVTLTKCADKATQEWVPEEVVSYLGVGYVFYSVADLDECLHASAAGTDVDTYTCNGNLNEIWYLGSN
jgi:hypothetical protein